MSPLSCRAAALAFAGLVAAAAPAAATGSISCSATTGRATLAAELAIGHITAGPIANAGGTIELKGRDIPADLATITLDRDALVHHWLEGEQINLHFYKERGDGKPFGYVEAVVTTHKVAKSDFDYAGRFRLKASYFRKEGDADPIEFQLIGRVTCSGD
jgi:hypothetical protein